MAPHLSGHHRERLSRLRPSRLAPEERILQRWQYDDPEQLLALNTLEDAPQAREHDRHQVAHGCPAKRIT
jgi:hypothetical protein